MLSGGAGWGRAANEKRGVRIARILYWNYSSNFSQQREASDLSTNTQSSKANTPTRRNRGGTGRAAARAESRRYMVAAVSQSVSQFARLSTVWLAGWLPRKIIIAPHRRNVCVACCESRRRRRRRESQLTLQGRRVLAEFWRRGAPKSAVRTSLVLNLGNKTIFSFIEQKRSRVVFLLENFKYSATAPPHPSLPPIP